MRSKLMITLSNLALGFALPEGTRSLRASTPTAPAGRAARLTAASG